MKIVSMTMVGNESEIIESFIRYNSNFVDEMLLITSGCIDNTVSIIQNLKREGYPLILADESLLSYEQRYVENKYMNLLAERGDIDWIIPLDADEFIISENNPRHIIESLPQDRVYELNWKNYVMRPDDDMEEQFIPKRITHYKKHEGTLFTKVILPAALVLEKRIVLETGRHHVFGENLIVEHTDSLKIAHFPSVSKEQYMSKLYCSSINFITWMNRGNGEGGHINKQISQLENEKDIFLCATGYGIDDANEDVLEKEPIDLSFCDIENLNIRYGSLAKVDLMRNLIHMGQIMAIKAYRMEIEKFAGMDKPNVLVYGTGKDANQMMNGLPDNLVNICAYIDSDPNKTFMMHNRRLIIQPKHVRFLSYDKIIISSSKYYDEMYQALIWEGTPEKKIVGQHYLFSLASKK